jgi:hypothetical protein
MHQIRNFSISIQDTDRDGLKFRPFSVAVPPC